MACFLRRIARMIRLRVASVVDNDPAFV